MTFTSDLEIMIDDIDCEVHFIPVHINAARQSEDGDLLIYIWKESKYDTGGPKIILEMKGNVNLELIGQYRIRYDPPRSASTGNNQPLRGDYHLFDRKGEIAAWDDQGKARHGWPVGTSIPRKAYDEIVDKYPNACGLKGKVLEHMQSWNQSKAYLYENDFLKKPLSLSSEEQR